MQLSLHGDTKALQKDLGKLTKRELPKAMRAAVGKTRTQIVSRLVKRVSKRLNIKPQKLVRTRVRPRGKVTKNFSAYFWVFTQPMPIDKLKPRQTKTGVTAAKRRYPGAFIVPQGARYYGGTVRKRVGKARHPLTRPSYPLQPQLGQIARHLVTRDGRVLFRKNFRSQIHRFMAKRR